MAYVQKDGEGSLFKNTKKRNEADKDYNGSVTIDGREYWLSGWIKQPKDSTKKAFISLKFEPKKEQSEQQPAKDRTAPPVRRPSTALPPPPLKKPKPTPPPTPDPVTGEYKW